MKRGTFILGLVLISLMAKGEFNEIVTINLPEQNKINKNDSGKIVINEKWIQKFQNYEWDSNHVGFADVFYELTGSEKLEFIKEYARANTENESLLEIKNRVSYNLASNELTEDEIEWFCNVKIEINQELREKIFVLGDKIKL